MLLELLRLLGPLGEAVHVLPVLVVLHHRHRAGVAPALGREGGGDVQAGAGRGGHRGQQPGEQEGPTHVQRDDPDHAAAAGCPDLHQADEGQLSRVRGHAEECHPLLVSGGGGGEASHRADQQRIVVIGLCV